MSNFPLLIEKNPEAVSWVNQVKSAYSRNRVFGKIVSSVIWSSATGPDGNELVPIGDPQDLVIKINTDRYPLLKGHDPGFPVGKVLRAQAFTSAGGLTFIAAILGFYADGARLSFRDFGFDPAAAVSSPPSLPLLPEGFWINLATDPRTVDSAWVEGVLRAAPVQVVQTELSYNAAESLQELINIVLPYLALVWNPFITSVATEAGKAAYAALYQWLRTVFGKLTDHRNPIVEIQSTYEECLISFILRGKNVRRLYMAHDALPVAAVQAAQLVENMKRTGNLPKRILYEFHQQDDKWFPSYAELEDGRLVTDNNILIAAEQLPSGLSLGIIRGKS